MTANFNSIPYAANIRQSGLTIYNPIEIGDPSLWIPTHDLESLHNEGLRGISLAGLPLRTRSKVAKEHVCRVIGYPMPRAFLKTQPRFLAQRFDTYVQKSNNLQVWNEELSPVRRYVLIRLSPEDAVTSRCTSPAFGGEVANLAHNLSWLGSAIKSRAA